MKSSFFKKKINNRVTRYETIDGVVFKDDGQELFVIESLFYDDVRKRIIEIYYTRCLESLRNYVLESMTGKYGYDKISIEDYVHEVFNFYKKDNEP